MPKKVQLTRKQAEPEFHHFQLSSAFGNRMVSAKDSGEIIRACYRVAERKGLQCTVTPEEARQER